MSATDGDAVGRSEADYSLLLSNMPDGFAYCKIVVDAGGRPVDFLYLKVNDNFQKLTGLRPAEVVGKRATELFPDLTSSKFDWIGTYGRVALEGTDASFEEFFEPLQKWFRISAYSPAKGYFAAVFLDITQLKHVQNELRALSTFLEGSPSRILRLMADGTVAYSNASGGEILKAWGIGVGGVAPEYWREIVKDALAKKASRVVELEYGPAFYSFTVDPLPELGYVNLYARDVTEKEMMVRAVRESEEKFRSMFESSGVGIGITTPDGHILEANPVLLSMMGYSEAESYGTTVQEHIHPDDRERVILAMKKMLATGAPNYQFEARFRHKDGHYFWMSQTASFVRDATGNPLYMIGILEDITSRKEAQEALTESEEEYRELVEKATSIILKIDLQGRIVSFNEYAERFFGYGREEVIGRSFFETVTPPTESTGRDLTKLMVDIVAHPEQYETNINENVKKSGDRVWIQWNNSVIRDGQGNAVGILCTGTDITERVRTADALAESEAKFRAAFENASLGATLTSLDGRWLRVNHALVDMLGYSAEELTARPFIEFMVPEDREETNRHRERLMAVYAGSYVIEQRYVRRDGMVISVSSNVSMVRGPSGEPLYTVALIADITKRKLAEEELKMYSTRLERLVQERTAELEETHRVLLETEGLAAIGRVSTQLAHDLRNPLAGIKMESYVLNELLAKSLDPRARDTLRLLSDSVTHAGKVIEDLLEYTRLQKPFRQQLELGACIADVVAAFPIPKGVGLVVKKAPKVRVLAEQGQLAKVVRSLLDNAMEAMPRGGRLTVSFELRGGFVSFSVADTGVGIDKEDLPKVFLPFYSTKAKGLGLSLNIARRTIEANGGSLELKSARGKGTKVTVTLPIALETPR